MAAPIHPFVPQRPAAIHVEVQAFDPTHCLHRMPPHGHAFFELIFVSHGSGTHIVDGHALDAEAGTVFVIPPLTIHDCRAMNSAAGWIVMFLEEGLREHAQLDGRGPRTRTARLLLDVFGRLTQAGLRSFALEPQTREHTLAAVRRIHDELANRRAGYELAVRAGLQLLLVDLARESRKATRPGARGDSIEMRSALLDRIFADIEAHAFTDASLGSASRRLGLTAGYLTTRLRQLTDRTYGDWVIDRRMIEARRLLSTTDRKIADIASDIGYAETESFIRRFRIHHRMTPARWRIACDPDGDT